MILLKLNIFARGSYCNSFITGYEDYSVLECNAV